MIDQNGSLIGDSPHQGIKDIQIHITMRRIGRIMRSKAKILNSFIHFIIERIFIPMGRIHIKDRGLEYE